MLEQVIRGAIAQTSADPRDAGVVELALTYARHIDSGDGDAAKLGPALLAALESLLMSPRARATAKKAVIDAKPTANPLDQLAQRRAGRGRPQGVDAAAP